MFSNDNLFIFITKVEVEYEESRMSVGKCGLGCNAAPSSDRVIKLEHSSVTMGFPMDLSDGRVDSKN